jgi:hypothetical protein
MPLPILPTHVLPVNDPVEANMHHAWHPSTAPELQGLAGQALRHSRVQLVAATDHNLGDKKQGPLTYHDYYAGPPLPTSEAEIFRMCVLAAAGYIPDRAIDIHGPNGPREIRINELQRGILRKPAVPMHINNATKARMQARAIEAYQTFERPTTTEAEYVNQYLQDFEARQKEIDGFHYRHLVYRYEPIRDFFRDYALRQDLRDVNELVIEEFLGTRDADRKARLGRWLLARAVERSTDPMEHAYADLRKDGYLHPLMPPAARLLTLYKLGNLPQRTQLVTEQEEVLKRQVGLAA